jgi:hypothetical protein
VFSHAVLRFLGNPVSKVLFLHGSRLMMKKMKKMLVLPQRVNTPYRRLQRSDNAGRPCAPDGVFQAIVNVPTLLSGSQSAAAITFAP